MTGEALKVSIEFAHPKVAAVDAMTDLAIAESFAGIAVAEALAIEMDNADHKVEMVIFTDDVNISQRPAGRFWTGMLRGSGEELVQDLTTEAEQAGRPITFSFVQESAMIPRALELAEEIKARAEESDNIGLTQDRTKLILKNNGKRERIKITGYGEHSELPSCDVLDLACYEHKLSNSDLTVTVIDKGYKPQQERVMALANLLGWDRAAYIIYVDSEGNKVDMQTWAESN